MCWEIFCSCCRPRIDEETAVSNSEQRKPPSSHSGPPSSLLKNGVGKPPGKDSEEPPITATAAVGDESSSDQESEKVDPAIKKGNTKSEEGKQGPIPNAKKHPIHNTATDTPTKEKEHVKDVSSEKRGHGRSADCISPHEGKPTFEHAPEAEAAAAAAAAAAAVSSKPSSAQKNEVVGSQANPKRTNQGERSVSMKEPSREAAAEYYRFPSVDVDGIGSQANQGRIDQEDQERHASMKEPSESSTLPRKDQRRGEAADGGHARLRLQSPGIG